MCVHILPSPMVPATKEAEAGSITTGLLWQLNETQVLKKKNSFFKGSSRSRVKTLLRGSVFV